MAIPTPTRPLNRLQSTVNGLLIDAPGNVDCAGFLCAATAPTVIAVNNDFTLDPGGTTLSVLTNDTIAGGVNLIPGTSPDPGIVMNPDGTIDVGLGVLPGTYVFTYTICETAAPTNCSEANVTITVTAPAVTPEAADVYMFLTGTPATQLCTYNDTDSLNFQVLISDPPVGATYELVGTDALAAESVATIATNPDTLTPANFSVDLTTMNRPISFTVRHTDVANLGVTVNQVNCNPMQLTA